MCHCLCLCRESNFTLLTFVCLFSQDTCFPQPYTMLGYVSTHILFVSVLGILVRLVRQKQIQKTRLSWECLNDTVSFKLSHETVVSSSSEWCNLHVVNSVRIRLSIPTKISISRLKNTTNPIISRIWINCKFCPNESTVINRKSLYLITYNNCNIYAYMHMAKCFFPEELSYGQYNMSCLKSKS